MGNGQWAMGNGQWAMVIKTCKIKIINLYIYDKKLFQDRLAEYY
jgi:hypothetical protein